MRTILHIIIVIAFTEELRTVILTDIRSKVERWGGGGGGLSDWLLAATYLWEEILLATQSKRCPVILFCWIKVMP